MPRLSANIHNTYPGGIQTSVPRPQRLSILLTPRCTGNYECFWNRRSFQGYEPAKLDSLEVTVYAALHSYPPGAILPVRGEKCRYDSITYGRDGGSRHAPSY